MSECRLYADYPKETVEHTVEVCLAWAENCLVL